LDKHYKNLETSVSAVMEILGNPTWATLNKEKLTLLPDPSVEIFVHLTGTGGVGANLVMSGIKFPRYGIPMLDFSPDQHLDLSFTCQMVMGLTDMCLALVMDLTEQPNEPLIGQDGDEVRELTKLIMQTVAFPCIKFLEFLLNSRLDAVKSDWHISAITAVKNWDELLGRNWEPDWL
jgi:hypothetical protein